MLAASICVATISVADIGSANSVALQSPSTGSNEPTVECSVFNAGADNEIDIDEFTYTLDPNLEIDPDKVYDGNTYLNKADPITVYSSDSADGEVVTSLDKGITFVRISYDSSWSYVRTEDGQEGYVDNSVMEDTVMAEDVTPTPTSTPAPTATPAPTRAPTATPTAAPESQVSETSCDMTLYATCSLNARSGPGITYSKITTYQTGDAIHVVATTDNGWYKTEAGYYVKSNYCSENMPTATPTPVPQETTTETSTSTDAADTSSDFATFVRSFIGVPYVYGGCSPSGLDCSGLVRYCYKTYYGITLPHSARLQAQLGTEVSASEITCGDIVCFDYDEDGSIDHSGLYIGGNTVIHASNSRGQVTSATFSSMTHVTTIRRVL